MIFLSNISVMSAFKTGGIMCILGLIQWALKYILRSGSSRYPEGPKPWGPFGNFLILRRLQCYPDQELRSIARSWGDTCMLWAAQYPMLIVNKPQVAKDLLVDVLSDPVMAYFGQSINVL